LAVPVVSVHCDFKKPLRYGDSVIVESTLIDTPAAKLKFEYKIFESRTRALVAIGSSVQVFVDVKTFELQLTMPPFFETWRKKMSVQI
jgi:acyl-CoA thioester hydrolase